MLAAERQRSHSDRYGEEPSAREEVGKAEDERVRGRRATSPATGDEGKTAEAEEG